MATFAQDLFTGTNGTAISAHTPDVGGSWVAHPASGDTLVIASNRARSSGGEGDYYNNGTPGSADYDVSADLFVASNSNYAGVTGRASTTVVTWYGAGYDNGNTRWEFFKGVAGSFTTLDTSTATLTASNTYNVKLSMLGTTIKLIVDGVTLKTATDSAIAAAGKSGCYSQSGAGSGYHIDNFLAADAGGGGGVTVRQLGALGVG